MILKMNPLWEGFVQLGLFTALPLIVIGVGIIYLIKKLKK